MTTDITELAQRMKAAAEKATPGEWWADEVKNEGCYGSGDDCVEGFTSYAIYGSDGQTLFDSLNSDAACISEEYDGEGHVAWDETAQRNAEFIALANPANIRALVEALEKAQQVDEELCKLLPPGVEYMDPPDGGDITPLEGVRRMVADYRQRIADLESRTVTFKLPFTPEPSAFAPWAAKAFYQFHKDTVKSCVAVFSDACAAAGIKVEAE
ncbi:ead/Ea22-like family protein [Klebsiella pneumoniae]|uniref:ead/Ea22-like family protein n=1 Tax=Klebsiella pneumoniae TaxID=573 RepID=UPI00217D7C3D|nr:ead/Ea22-like family protein [Klebsiella pneumoniae]MCS5999642.1 ead/Ea22-like family protein [Klebsiella pneumoniae subsp. pneumoniae]